MIHTVPAHAKFRRLVRRLRPLLPAELPVSIETLCVGLLERLWHTTATSAKRGDIGKFSNEDIAELIGWQLDADADTLIEALIETGWLDRCGTYRLLVHDWSQHAPNFVKGNVTQMGGFHESSDIPATSPEQDTQGGTPKVSHSGQDTQGVTPPNPTLPDPTITASAVCSEQGSEPPDDQEKKRKKSSPPSGYAFKIKGGKTWSLPQEKFEQYRNTFRQLDVEAELRKARQWCEDNTSKRKTAGGMPKFLTGWLNNAGDNPTDAPVRRNGWKAINPNGKLPDGAIVDPKTGEVLVCDE